MTLSSVAAMVGRRLKTGGRRLPVPGHQSNRWRQRRPHLHRHAHATPRLRRRGTDQSDRDGRGRPGRGSRLHAGARLHRLLGGEFRTRRSPLVQPGRECCRLRYATAMEPFPGGAAPARSTPFRLGPGEPQLRLAGRCQRGAVRAATGRVARTTERSSYRLESRLPCASRRGHGGTAPPRSRRSAAHPCGGGGAVRVTGLRTSPRPISGAARGTCRVRASDATKGRRRIEIGYAQGGTG